MVELIALMLARPAFAGNYALTSTADEFTIRDTTTGSNVVSVTRLGRRGAYRLVTELEDPPGCRLHLEPKIVENIGCTALYSNLDWAYLRGQMPKFGTITVYPTDGAPSQARLIVTEQPHGQLMIVFDGDGNGEADVSQSTAFVW